MDLDEFRRQAREGIATKVEPKALKCAFPGCHLFAKHHVNGDDWCDQHDPPGHDNDDGDNSISIDPEALKRFGENVRSSMMTMAEASEAMKQFGIAARKAFGGDDDGS